MKEIVCTAPVEVAAGVVWQEQRFLAALRPSGALAGFWEFPGGKREPGESMQQTLSRELREELGITVLHTAPFTDFIYDYPHRRVHLVFSHVLAFSGCPAPQEGQELRWLTPEEARRLPFLPANKPLLEHLAKPSV